MQLFYNSDVKPEDKSFFFDKEESKHIIKVLRKLKSLIADPQAQEKLRSYPEWEISLI